MKSPQILLMAGGTGGHIFPALAVADWLRRHGWSATWLGSTGGMEELLVPINDIPLETIPVVGLRGKSMMSRIVGPFMLLRSLWQAMRIIQRIKPDVVLGMGGFASGPGGLASWLLRYPLCIHEQNAIAGMTNRLLAKFATYQLEAFPESLPNADAQVGNPVRSDIADLDEPETRYATHEGPLRILVVGGSRGAAVLNKTVPESLQFLTQATDSHVWHQAGKGNRGIVLSRYSDILAEQPEALKERIQVTDFIDDMPAAYQWADLVICRSGALTVSELAAAGLASILIPFPHAVDDHQTVNARYLADADAATLLPQTQLTAEYLANQIDQMSERDQCLQMAIKARAKARTQATADVARYCAKAAGISLPEVQA